MLHLYTVYLVLKYSWRKKLRYWGWGCQVLILMTLPLNLTFVSYYFSNSVILIEWKWSLADYSWYSFYKYDCHIKNCWFNLGIRNFNFLSKVKKYVSKIIKSTQKYTKILFTKRTFYIVAYILSVVIIIVHLVPLWQFPLNMTWEDRSLKQVYVSTLDYFSISFYWLFPHALVSII